MKSIYMSLIIAASFIMANQAFALSDLDKAAIYKKGQASQAKKDAIVAKKHHNDATKMHKKAMMYHHHNQ